MPDKKIEPEWGFVFIADRIDDVTEIESGGITTIIEKIISGAQKYNDEILVLTFVLRAKSEFLKILHKKITEINTDITILGDGVGNNQLMLYNSKGKTLEYVDYDISKSEGIEKIMTSHFSISAPKKNGLITWGHGGGYSFFNAPNNGTNNTSTNEKYQFLKLLEDKNNFLRYYYSKEYEKLNGSKFNLNMFELKTGIKRALKKGKLNICIMSHCNMAYFETAFMMSFVTNYLIAAPSALAYDFIPFSNIFKSINNGTLNDEKEISQKITLSQQTEEPISLFIYDLSGFVTLRRLVYKLTGYLLDEMIDKKNILSIKDIREKCTIMGTHNELGFVDLYELADSFIANASHLKNKGIFYLSRSIKKEIEGIIVARALNDDIKRFAIYFPLSPVSEIDIKLESAIIKKRRKKWHYLIYKFLNLVAKLN